MSSLPLRHRVEFLLLEDVVGFLDFYRQTEILNITRCAGRWDRVSIVRTVFFSSCRRTEVRSE